MKSFRKFLRESEQSSEPSEEIVAYGSIGDREDITSSNTSSEPIQAYGSIGGRPDIKDKSDIQGYGSIGHRSDISPNTHHNTIQFTPSGIKLHLKEQYDPKVSGQKLFGNIKTSSFLEDGAGFGAGSPLKRPQHAPHYKAVLAALGHHHKINHETMIHNPDGEDSEREALEQHFKTPEGIAAVAPHPTIHPKDDPRFRSPSDAEYKKMGITKAKDRKHHDAWINSKEFAAYHLLDVRKKDPEKYKAYINRTSEDIKTGEGVHDYTTNSTQLNHYLFKHHKHPKFLDPKHIEAHEKKQGLPKGKIKRSTVEALDKITNDKRNAAKNNFRVFSGIGAGTGKEIYDAKPGAVIHFPAYTSTSSDPSIAHQFARDKADQESHSNEHQSGEYDNYHTHHHAHVAVFHLPKGYHKIRYLGDHSTYTQEREGLLARGQKFKKVKTETIQHNTINDYGDKETAFTHVHHLVPA